RAFRRNRSTLSGVRFRTAEVTSNAVGFVRQVHPGKPNGQGQSGRDRRGRKSAPGTGEKISGFADQGGSNRDIKRQRARSGRGSDTSCRSPSKTRIAG